VGDISQNITRTYLTKTQTTRKESSWGLKGSQKHGGDQGSAPLHTHSLGRLYLSDKVAVFLDSTERQGHNSWGAKNSSQNDEVSKNEGGRLAIGRAEQ